MSLPVFNPQTHLFGLQAASSEVFDERDRYRLFAQQIYPLLVQARPTLQVCYCEDNGRPAVEPVLLLGVSLLQFVEKVPDRQAVQMLKYHLGWKFALNQELVSETFDPTVLVRFRERLIAHEQARLGFELVLAGLRQAGLVPRKGKQRLDSTHVLGLVSRMSWLERVRESLRLALEQIAEQVGSEQRPAFWSQLWERYVESQLDYQSPEETVKQKMKQAGEDILQLRAWLGKQPRAVQQLDQVQLLERIFAENFAVDPEGQFTVRQKSLPGAVQNPHDPEAEWCTKRTGEGKKEWVGYKMQVAETVPDQPVGKGELTHSFITSIVTQTATGSDEVGLEQTFQEQAEMGLDKPSELYTDGAYISGKLLAAAQAEGREVLGPAQPPAQTGSSVFKADAFQVDVEQRRAICPAGKENTQCSRLEEEKTRKVNYRFEWSTHCHDCPLWSQCVGGGQKHRTLVVGEYHTALQARRLEMQTEAFGNRMHQRNAIEGTHSELVRGHAARRARYRGLNKVRLQNYFIGAACNVKRWLRLLAWQIQQTGRGGAQCVPQTS